MTIANFPIGSTLFILSLFLIIIAFGQEKKVATASQELTNKIASMDSMMFEAFNKQDMPKFKALFTEDLV